MSLAILGGKPVRNNPFPAYRTIGEEEKEAVNRVLDSGVLSQFLGCWHDHFYGGPEVQALEKEWAAHFKVKHAIAVNSCTSGLYAAVGAVSTEPGDEIIVPPFTMSASVMAPLIFNAIPVFSDIEPDYFCLDASVLEEKITSRTRAIIVVDLFGQAYDFENIRSIAQKHNLTVIEDCAQSPGALYKQNFAGTLGDIGVYSLNYHKHIHCGEGGMVVTNNDNLAEKIQLIRNHAEAVVGSKKSKDLTNMIGFNFRMTEIEAAIARCQLEKLPQLVEKRQENVSYLENHLSKIPALTMPLVRKDGTHTYYVHAIKYNEQVLGIKREAFTKAIKAELQPTTLRENEGVKIGNGYIAPLYHLPIFQNQIAYGSKGYPFNTGEYNYDRGHCPVTEALYERTLITHELIHPGMTKDDLDDVIFAFEKVFKEGMVI
jgi:dTDP-4-amino-4,6-dideoxygalactose transaminase